MANSNVEAVRAVLAAANRQDPEAWASFYSPCATNHGRAVGREGMLAVFRSLIRAFPDFHFEEVQLLSAGDTVAAELIMSGTHRGTPDLPVLGGLLVGVAPTGRRVSVPNMHFYRFEERLIVEHHAVRDDLGLMQQLGLLPARG